MTLLKAVFVATVKKVPRLEKTAQNHININYTVLCRKIFPLFEPFLEDTMAWRIFSSFNWKTFLGYFKHDIAWEISKRSSASGDTNQMMEKISPFLYNSYHVIQGMKSSGMSSCSASPDFTTSRFSTEAWHSLVPPPSQQSYSVVPAHKWTVPNCLSIPEAELMTPSVDLSSSTRGAQILAIPHGISV